MLQQINRKLEKMMPFITPASVIFGVIFSAYIKDFSFLVPWLFAFMTFEGSLSMNFKSIKGAITHPFPVFMTLIFLHIVMPLWALAVGHITFNGDTLTITGIVLGMVIPTGITSFIWVAMKKGSTALTLAIILIDSILSPFIVPFTLSLLVGEKIELDASSMMVSLLFMIVLPSIVGMLLNGVTRGRIKDVWKPRLSPISKVFLGCIVMLNGAVVAPYLIELNIKLLFIIFVVFFISFTGYMFAFLLAKWLKFDQDTTIAITFTGGMRNISAGTVIAISFFPPAVIIPVVVGMLFQQSLASLYGAFLDRHYNKKEQIAGGKSA
ncbi:bile acid:sodium symporter family protein [Bacillus sp. V3B]|uniref:bile acid:sodium symporter family protein n=1 Tax=Bacillus sp. V3B TaxID=2804915 RepID=UPI00210CC6D1|nr:bile acid:sodium symporter family protein [Bacillus sp. V3B]MCQ6276289.1 bile acid:sodium symporter family protein [Bacillus sp. V3B]